MAPPYIPSGSLADSPRDFTSWAYRRSGYTTFVTGGATMALAAGVHPKIVQERLGHANIGITLDIYSHVTATLHGEAAEKVADLVFRRS